MPISPARMTDCNPTTSPFKHFESEGIANSPYGLTPREFLEIHCDEIPAHAWVDLARHFLAAVKGEAGTQ